jgi:hypothetical protein
MKRVKIEIAHAATIGSLYKKARALVGSAAKFTLAFHAAGGLVQLTDLERTVSEANCANCLVRLLPE